jgi:hypothetical protein
MQLPGDLGQITPESSSHNLILTVGLLFGLGLLLGVFL